MRCRPTSSAPATGRRAKRRCSSPIQGAACAKRRAADLARPLSRDRMTIAQGLPRDSMFRRCAQAFCSRSIAMKFSQEELDGARSRVAERFSVQAAPTVLSQIPLKWCAMRRSIWPGRSMETAPFWRAWRPLADWTWGGAGQKRSARCRSRRLAGRSRQSRGQDR